MSTTNRNRQGVTKRDGHKPPTGLLGSPVTRRRPIRAAGPSLPSKAVWVVVDSHGTKTNVPKILDNRNGLLLSLLEELQGSLDAPDVNKFLQDIMLLWQKTPKRPAAQSPAPKIAEDELAVGELDAALDQLDPDSTPARDAMHFRRIIAARKKVAEAEAELRSAVKDARNAGDSWTVIGAALDTSRQAAFQRFGKD